MQDRIKEDNPALRLNHTRTSTISEHSHNTGHQYPLWNDVHFIDCDPHWYTCRVKEAIHIRLQPNNINRDSGIEIPEAWMPTIKKHNRRTVQTGGIEMQPITAVETSQSQQSIQLYKVTCKHSHSAPARARNWTA